MGFLCVSLFFIGLVLMGVFAVVQEIVRLYKIHAWPHVHGVITDSVVERLSDSDGDTFQAVVYYEYDADGQHWQQHTKLLPFTRGNRKIAEKAAVRYRLDESTQVAYNPKNPAHSTLAGERDIRVRLSPFVWTAVSLLLWWLAYYVPWGE
jgi:hypothetical protein